MSSSAGRLRHEPFDERSPWFFFLDRSTLICCQSVKIAQPAHSNASRAHLKTPTQHGGRHAPRRTQLECRHQRRLRERAPRVRGQRLARLRMQSANPTACAMLVQNGGATTRSPAALWPWQADSRATLSRGTNVLRPQRLPRPTVPCSVGPPVLRDDSAMSHLMNTHRGNFHLAGHLRTGGRTPHFFEIGEKCKKKPSNASSAMRKA